LCVVVGMAKVNGVRFDFSGSYLGVSGEAAGGAGKLSVSVVKEWTETVSLSSAQPLHGLAWGPFAHALFAGAHDGAVLAYGTK